MMIIRQEEVQDVMHGEVEKKVPIKTCAKLIKKVAGNYALLANNISTYNRLSGKELTTEKQIDKFEKAMYAVDTALSNIKQADIDYGTKAVDKAIRNAKITSEVESTGIATLLSAGLTIATGNLWAPIILPNASNIYKNSKANTAIKESRSKYVK
jgi:hypothetical protein